MPWCDILATKKNHYYRLGLVSTLTSSKNLSKNEKNENEKKKKNLLPD
jgi:hypothetical protein